MIDRIRIGGFDGAQFRRSICACLVLALAVLPLSAGAPPAGSHGLLGDTYPIENSTSFHKAFLHWMDSLSMLTGHGTTGGKTIPAHRSEFDRMIGKPTRKDVSMLERYHAVRSMYLRDAPVEDRDRITLAFFEASSLDAALETTGEFLRPNQVKALGDSMRHFVPRYEQIWNEGEVVEGFLDGLRASERRQELAESLAGVARFFDVPPDGEPRPQIVLAPVPGGHGTHAQAIGSFLLIEVRKGEKLADEAAPIVHENAHFLYRRIPRSRRELLKQTAYDAGGREAWGLLREALPTAIAQGVAARSFLKDTWAEDGSWYHDPSIDRYAKQIFPLIDDALANGGTLDEEMIKKLVAVYEPADGT